MKRLKSGEVSLKGRKKNMERESVYNRLTKGEGEEKKGYESR